MKLRVFSSSLLFGLVCLHGAIAGPLDKPVDDKLSGETIKATWFNGQPFIATGPDGVAFKFTYQPDGHASKVPLGKKAAPVSGFWRIIAEGYCVRWTGSVREKCFNIRNEDGKTIARFGKIIVATWSR